MSDDSLPTHVKEMRNYIAYAGNGVPNDIIKEYAKEALSPVLNQAQLVVESLENIGLERLSLLFEDRSHAEIILENCITFRKKFADEDFHTTELIAEAFTQIFEKVKKEKFELIGLTEGQISVLTGNVQILSESYRPAIIKEDVSVFGECLEKMKELISEWESHREMSDSPVDFNEGIETGFMRAADDLTNLYNEYKSKVHQMEIDEGVLNKSTLTEEKGDT